MSYASELDKLVLLGYALGVLFVLLIMRDA